MGFPPDRFFLLSPIPEVEQKYADYCKLNRVEFDQTLRVRFCNFYEMAWLLVSQEYTKRGMIPSIPDVENQAHKIRKKYFLCTNNEARYHRRAFYCWLNQEGLEKKGHVSFIDSRVHTDVERSFSNQFTDSVLNDLLERFEMFETQLPQILDTDKVHLSDHHSWPFEESYFSIVTERIFKSTPGWSLPTSKIFKTIHSMHPFIVLAQPGYLASLRKMGFETYPEFFDERYDYEPDFNKRFQMVQKEVKKMCSIPLEEVHKLYQRVLPKIIRNRKRLEGHWDQSKFHEVVAEIESFSN